MRPRPDYSTLSRRQVQQDLSYRTTTPRRHLDGHRTSERPRFTRRHKSWGGAVMGAHGHQQTTAGQLPQPHPWGHSRSRSNRNPDPMWCDASSQAPDSTGAFPDLLRLEPMSAALGPLTQPPEKGRRARTRKDHLSSCPALGSASPPHAAGPRAAGSREGKARQRRKTAAAKAGRACLHWPGRGTATPTGAWLPLRQPGCAVNPG